MISQEQILEQFKQKDYQLVFHSLNDNMNELEKANNQQYSIVMNQLFSLIDELKQNPNQNYQSFFNELEKFLPNISHINPYQYLNQTDSSYLTSMLEHYEAKSTYQYLLSNLPNNFAQALSYLASAQKDETIAAILNSLNVNTPESIGELRNMTQYKKMMSMILNSETLTQLASEKHFSFDLTLFNFKLAQEQDDKKVRLFIQANPDLAYDTFFKMIKEHQGAVGWFLQDCALQKALFRNRDLFTSEQQKEIKKSFVSLCDNLFDGSINKMFFHIDTQPIYDFALSTLNEYKTDPSLSQINFSSKPLFHHLMQQAMSPSTIYYNSKTQKQCSHDESNTLNFVYYNAHFNRALMSYLEVNGNNTLPNLLNDKGIVISPFHAFILNFNKMNSDYGRLLSNYSYSQSHVEIKNFGYIVRSLIQNNTDFFKQDNADLFACIKLLSNYNDKDYIKNFINSHLERIHQPTINWNVVVNKNSNTNSAFKRLFTFWKKDIKVLENQKIDDAKDVVKLSDIERMKQKQEEMNIISETYHLPIEISEKITEFFKSSVAILTVCEQLPSQFIEEQINVKKMGEQYIFDIVNNYVSGVKMIQNKDKILQSTVEQVNILNEEITTIYSKVQEKMDNDAQQKVEELGEFLQKRYKSGSM